jgi:hypothetical protein
MGKREDIKKPKSPRDFYATIDPDAVKPLIPFVKGKTYAEPCAGNGDLIQMLHNEGVVCVYASDIEYSLFLQTNGYWGDATKTPLSFYDESDVIITNPPFSKALLLPIMDHLMQSGIPLWLLLPADIIQNKYMAPYMKKCKTILSVGRLCWFPNEVTGKMVKGVDNFVWLEFVNYDTSTVFHGRMEDDDH